MKCFFLFDSLSEGDVRFFRLDLVPSTRVCVCVCGYEAYTLHVNAQCTMHQLSRSPPSHGSDISEPFHPFRAGSVSQSVPTCSPSHCIAVAENPYRSVMYLDTHPSSRIETAEILNYLNRGEKMRGWERHADGR